MVYVASLLLSLLSTYALIIINIFVSFRCIAKKTNLRDFSDIFGFRCTLQSILHHSFFLEKLEKTLYSNNIITNSIKRELQSRRTQSSQIELHDTYHHILHQLGSSYKHMWPRWFNLHSIDDIFFIVAAQVDISNVGGYRVMIIDGVSKLCSAWIFSVMINNNPQSLLDIFGALPLLLPLGRIEMSVTIQCLCWPGPFLLFLYTLPFTLFPFDGVINTFDCKLSFGNFLSCKTTKEYGET